MAGKSQDQLEVSRMPVAAPVDAEPAMGGFLDELRALRRHGRDYPLRGPIERLLGLGGFLLFGAASLALLAYQWPVIPFLFTAALTAGFGHGTFRQGDIRSRSARAGDDARRAARRRELVDELRQAVRGPAGARPVVLRDCQPVEGELDSIRGLFAGMGVGFGGRWAFDPATQSYRRTRYLFFANLPVFALGRYRVLDLDEESYAVLGELPRTPMDHATAAGSWLLLLVIGFLIFR